MRREGMGQPGLEVGFKSVFEVEMAEVDLLGFGLLNRGLSGRISDVVLGSIIHLINTTNLKCT